MLAIHGVGCGRYYLTCAVPGTEYATYCDNCYIAPSPIGPFVFAPNSPVSRKSTTATLRIFYSAIAPAKVRVSVNGKAAADVELPKTRGWPTYASHDVPLAEVRKSNAIRIEGLGASFNLDAVQLLP